jgi:hypothetical protein
VSPLAVGAPVIHVHITELNSYVSRSALFRRSVAKYPSVVGCSLSAYAPTAPMSREELLHDSLGISSLLERVDHLIRAPDHREGDEANGCASLIDISAYCVLHSVRNTLRWRGRYEEFSPTDELVTMWEDIFGPEVDTLDRFVRWKYARRQGRLFSREEENSSAIASREFLVRLVEWIMRTPNRL